MDLIIYWTDSAVKQLNNIFEYYKDTEDAEIARKIVTRIVDKTILLEKQPQMGQTEELLKDRKNHYRYILEGHYKIIYWVERSNVNIAAVFDSRQNPSKIGKVI